MIRQLQHEFIVYIDNISNRVEWACIVSAADAGCLRVTPCCIPRVVKNLARKFPPKTVHQKLVWQSALGVQLVLLRLEGWSRRSTKSQHEIHLHRIYEVAPDGVITALMGRHLCTGRRHGQNRLMP